MNGNFKENMSQTKPLFLYTGSSQSEVPSESDVCFLLVGFGKVSRASAPPVKFTNRHMQSSLGLALFIHTAVSLQSRPMEANSVPLKWTNRKIFLALTPLHLKRWVLPMVPIAVSKNERTPNSCSWSSCHSGTIDSRTFISTQAGCGSGPSKRSRGKLAQLGITHPLCITILTCLSPPTLHCADSELDDVVFAHWGQR